MNKNFLNRSIAVACGFVLALSGISAAYAGGKLTDYNTTVSKFNGSGYSGYQTKSVSSKAGRLESKSVGGRYTVDARMNAASGTGPWVRRINDNDHRDLPNGVGAEKKTRVQFSTNLTTRVNVQVSGKWKSN